MPNGATSIRITSDNMLSGRRAEANTWWPRA
jgi:hypothetical protein